MLEQIGKFEIKEKIGEGGMGVVYKAYDPLMHRNVAIKTFTAELEVEPEVRSRFLREAIAVGRLTHPNIVTVHDVFEEGSGTYMVMEYLEGQSLGRAMRTGSLKSLEDKLWVMEEVCTGLTFAHSMGVVHRDIKPANIFLTKRGEVKILDFGIARIASTTVSKSATKIMGTPYYMSPEQWSGGKIDHRADIFALGVMLYEMLTGRRPFESHNSQAVAFQVINSEPTPIHELDTTVPAGLVDIVEKSLAKKPDERFADVQEISDGLHEITDALSDPDLDFEETKSIDATPQVRPPTRPSGRSGRASGRTPRSRSKSQPQTVAADPKKRWLWVALAATSAIAIAAVGFLLTRDASRQLETPVESTSIPAATSTVDEIVIESPVAEAPVAATSSAPAPTTAPSSIAATSIAPTTVPAVGTLIVQSTAGASITVDGRAMGTAPARLTLEPGTHRIRLSTPRVSWEDVVTIERGATTTHDRPLDETGALAVNSEIWATIRLGAGEAHETPHFFQNVPTGRHTLHVTRDGYQSQSVAVTIRAGETFQLTLEMREN